MPWQVTYSAEIYSPCVDAGLSAEHVKDFP